LTIVARIVTLCNRFRKQPELEALLEEESMGRTRMGVAVVVLSAAAVIAASGALAATPQEIYRDYADNGRLDNKYSPADLERTLKDAVVQQYPGPGEEGLPPAVEEGNDGSTSGGTSGGTTSGGTAGGSSGGGTAGGGTTAGGTAGASSGTPPVQASGGLPFTGLDLGLIAAGALGLILLGTALRRVARQRA
jgi:uncharacterized membrane protein YgcG